jgi:hypothetical protein
MRRIIAHEEIFGKSLLLEKNESIDLLDPALANANDEAYPLGASGLASRLRQGLLGPMRLQCWLAAALHNCPAWPQALFVALVPLSLLLCRFWPAAFEAVLAQGVLAPSSYVRSICTAQGLDGCLPPPLYELDGGVLINPRLVYPQGVGRSGIAVLAFASHVQRFT